MTDSPPIELAVGEPSIRPRDRVLLPTRYRHPGDVIRLIAAAGVLAAAAVTAALLPALLRPAAAAITAVQLATPAGQVLTGLVQVTIAAAAALVLLVAALRYRRFRVLAIVAGGFAAAVALMAGISYLAGPGGSAGLPAGLRQGSWLTGAGFPDPAVLAGLAAVAVAAAPWLSRPWRRAAWAVLLLLGVARLITGGLLPMQLVLALATGVTVGAALLVVFGVPDRRMGPAGVAAALHSGSVPVSQVTGPVRHAKGSRPFQAVTDDGRALFVKVFGSDQRDADLLYRAWRGIRLRGVGDTRPASSLLKAVEHEALLAVMAERAGVAVPRVGQVIRASDGSVLLTMELIAGESLDDVPAGRITDQLASSLWREVARLHQARIAHRSLRGANIMIGQNGCPLLVDFSFAELAATSRQQAIDVTELLISLAARVGPDRAVASAAAAIGAGGVAVAVPLLQPLALSAGTRRAIKGQDGLLKQTRAAAIAASGDEGDQGLARLQRVRPRTLLAIAALAGAFYFLLPQIAQVSSSWHALEHANWAWLPVIIGLSALTYVASAMALIGSVPGHVPFGPAVLARGASSFINRVSPANVGGMALNARFLQKSGAVLERRRVLRAACLVLAAACCACTSASGRGPADRAGKAGQQVAVITVGSFDFPESVLLADIYGGALAATGFPVRVLPDLGSREVVDPALMSGLVQIVPEYSGSALEFVSLGQLSVTSSSAATSRALAEWVAARNMVSGRASAAQDGNVIVVTAATAARYGLRSIADLARWASRLVFGGPPECPERAYCLPGLRQTYGLRFKKPFIPLDAGGPLTLQALEAGDISVALLFSTDPAITAQHLVVLADNRGLQPAENVTPLVRRDVVVRYGPRLLAVLNAVSARLSTGSLRALDAQVELRGDNPRRVAASWLRAQGLASMGGAVP